MSDQPRVAYPERWAADVVLADGGTVRLRPIRPEDAPRILALHGRMSERTRYFRYFSPYPRMPERDLRRFVEVDHERRVALVAELAGELIAVGRFDRIGDSTDAEVAFVVEDAHQGRGLGSVLLEHLAAIARELGLVRFVAEVLPENNQMIKVFADAGYAAERRYDSGVVHLTFPVAETGTSVRVRWAREQRAEAASIARLLRPGSVAVIGASTDPDSIGQALLRHLLDPAADFAGPVYPVHPRAVEVAGRPAYPSVGEIPGPVDLAVVAVPAHAVPRVIAECAEKGVHAAVVISAGFAETGAEGQRAERELVRAARRGGMRIVGPNALGVINTAAGLNASLVPFLPARGRVGFFCQSGALGVAVLEQVVLRGLGLSAFVSAGNRADVSGNDLLQYWASDPETDVVLLYLETFGNPRKFGRLARRLARGRPVVVVKGGRSGTVAPGLAGKATPLPEEHVEALFAASGVIRVDTVSELFDAGQLLAYQPLPAGGRVAVVGNSAALALLTEEACVAAGLAVTRRVDIGPTAGPGALASAVRDVLADREVDALVAVFVPVPQRDGGPYADALATAVAGAGKPVVSTFLALEGMPERLRQVSLPSYPSPEVAVRALARVAAYAEWRRRPPGDAPELPGLRPEAGAAVVAAALADHPAGADLAAPDVASLLDAYGIALTPDGDPPGVAVRVELRWDPSFGAIVGYGLAGVATSLFGDWAYRPVPLTDVDAAALVRAPKAAPLLLDHDLDVEALEDLVLRISRLADDHPEVAGLTLDPLIVTPDGCTLRAATAHVTPATRPDAGPRRL